MPKFICPICGASDSIFIGNKNGHPYCRRCVSFRGDEVIGDLSYPKSAPIYIDYDLSEDQKRLSKIIIDNYKDGKNTLVHAVCGSGKTEIVLEVIKYAINCGEHVGFAIPRRDVVIEIYQRFKEIFAKNNIISVYGGHAETLEGDLVILTTHQLYRYYHYFDLLIVDEIDAFPYNGNEVLKSFFLRSIKSNYVLMSATPSEELLEEFNDDKNKMVELFSRFHSYPLPIPEFIKGNSLKLFVKLVDLTTKFIKQNKPVMIFVPTIELASETYEKMSLFIAKGNYVHSKRKSRQEIISKFRKGEYRYLVTTAVLERGVTVKNVQVIVFHADHFIYSHHTLIQIAGRVGRKKDAPEGEVIYLVNKENEEINKSIDEIIRANKNLQNMF